MLTSCANSSNTENTVNAEYISIPPIYDSVKIEVTKDTINFPLDDSTYNSIDAFNYFTAHNKSYLSFYEKQSRSLNIYDFDNKTLQKRIQIKHILGNEFMYKTAVYTKNLDSIIILNRDQLLIIDTTGRIHQQISYIQGKNNYKLALLGNDNPPIFHDQKLYLIIRPNVKETSINEIKNWKNLYCLDIGNSYSKLQYSFPMNLRNNMYGRRLVTPSYCSNSSGNFVFSFSGDKNIYETDLQNYHKSYFAGSQYQKDEIQPVSKEALSTNQGFKHYLLRDSYGSLYFDSDRKIYLRVSRRKISMEEYYRKQYKKQQSIIIINHDFKIIGESNIESNILLNTLIFTKEGEIFARVNPQNEYQVSFIKLKYIP